MPFDLAGTFARRVEVALLVACLLLSSVAVAPARRALAGIPAPSTRAVGSGTGASAPCDAASVAFRIGVAGDGSDAAAIQAAVDASLTGDTVFLCDGVYDLTTGITLASSSATSLTFRGESTTGTIVDGGDAIQLFDATDRDVTFIGLTLRHGRIAGNGGAVSAANVAVAGAVFTDNATIGYSGGGAIYAEGSVSATDATFERNSAGPTAGYGGGAILAMTGSITITRGTYADNSTYGFGGGAILADAGSISVRGGTFTRNAVTYPGAWGGGAVMSFSGAVEVSGATFTENAAADRGGGAVMSYENTVTVMDSAFARNSAPDTDGGGGAIRAFHGAVVVARVSFTDNTTAGYAGGGAIAAGTSVSVADAAFTRNVATSVPGTGGGAIAAAGSVAVTRASFQDNATAGYQGGGAIRAGAAISATDVTFTRNAATHTGGYGGGAIRSAGPVTISRGTFTDNTTAGYGGGGIYSDGAVSVAVGSFSRNVQGYQTGSGGGAIYAGASVSVSDATFTDNTSGGYYGGGAVSAGGPVAVTDATFARNSTTGGYGGGAIYAGGYATVTRGSFADNTTVAGDGGAIYSADGVSVTGGVFTRNIGWGADGGGGAIYSQRAVAVERAAFTDNSTGGYYGGGAIYADGSVSVADATFTRNRGTYVAGYGGGAIFSWSGPVSVIRASFSDNTTAGYGGGAIYANDLVVTVDRATFTGNVQAMPGGYGGGAIYAEDGASVTASTFAGNEARGQGGGAIRTYSGTVSVVDSTFVENTSGTRGGAIHSKHVRATNATFVDNSAATGSHISATDWTGYGSVTAGDTIFAGGTCETPAVTSIGTNLTTDASCPGDVTTGAALALLPLGDHGGPTPTVALGTGSVAIDATTGIAGDGACLTQTDQRGVTRPQGGACDVGAFEYTVSNGTTPTSRISSPRVGDITGGSPAIVIGESVTDVATVTGLLPNPSGEGSLDPTSGSVTFYACFDASVAPTTCTSGTAVGNASMDGGASATDGIATATATWTPAAIGWYLIRAVYDPSGGTYAGSEIADDTTHQLIHVTAPAATFEFAGAYFMKASGSLTTVPLTAYIVPAVPACVLTYSLSDGTRTYGPYTVTTDSSVDTTTASLPKGTYSIELVGSGGCVGAAATGRLTIATGQSTAGTSGSGDYTAGASVVTFSHSVTVSTAESKRGAGIATLTTTSLSWAPNASWRLTAERAEGFGDGRSTWIRMRCPDDIEGLRPASCGRFYAVATAEEWTTGTRGRKPEWVVRGSTFVLVTVYDGGTACSVVGRKQVCTALPDWYGIEYLSNYKPAFADQLMTGTMTRIRNGSIVAD